MFPYGLVFYCLNWQNGMKNLMNKAWLQENPNIMQSNKEVKPIKVKTKKYSYKKGKEINCPTCP